MQRINSISGREVVSVARNSQYNTIFTGKYVLADSPGINATKEDEQMTDYPIKKGHVIMFVISSKGGFESEKNYR